MHPEVDPTDVTVTCPVPVRRPVMIHRWDLLTFLHWPYPPEVVQRLLPPGLEVHTAGGLAWVGLVPFHMQARAPAGAAVPWLSNFPETNVRTYARAADGSTGVWFLSLDAARLGAVAGGRYGYRLPYLWSHMSVNVVGPSAVYRSRRRWPGPRGARCDAAVEVGERLADHEISDFEHWLTGRYRLFSVVAGRVTYALADHPPWTLHRARLRHLDQDVLEAAGLPSPEGDPLVHWSPGIEVRIGAPHRVGHGPGGGATAGGVTNR